jgi:hypothetical protein
MMPRTDKFLFIAFILIQVGMQTEASVAAGGRGAVYQDDKNEYGCSLRDQTGSAAVKNFEAIIASLSPELRAAFETERAARLAELESYLAEGERQTGAAWLDSAGCLEQAPEALAQLPWVERLLQKVGQISFREMVENFLPRIAAHQ